MDGDSHKQLYADNEGTGDNDEPEIRRQLRAQRLAERHGKMRAALQEKQAVEQEEEKRRAMQVTLKEQHHEKISTWKKKHKVIKGKHHREGHEP